VIGTTRSTDIAETQDALEDILTHVLGLLSASPLSVLVPILFLPSVVRAAGSPFPFSWCKRGLGTDRGLFFTNLRICVGRNMCDVRKEQICYSNAQIDFCYSNAQPMELRICAFKIDLRI
jgi:hypothetical protein